MFKLFQKKNLSIDQIETVIGANTSFKGHIKCDGNLRVDGLYEGGVIEAVGNVVVSPEARVTATIIAEHVSVSGEVNGAIYARGHLEILSTGRVDGDVQVQNFYKDDDGILLGNLNMGQELENAPQLKTLAEQASPNTDASFQRPASTD